MARRSMLIAMLATAALLATVTPALAFQRAATIRQMIDGVNQARARNGKPPLVISPRLMRSSQSYSSRLIRSNVFAHSGLASARGFRLRGEALEMHSGSSPRPGWALRALLRSPVHRQLLLSGRMNRIGTGVARGRFQGHRTVIWVVHLGRS